MSKTIGLFLILLFIVSCQKKEAEVVAKSETTFLKASDLYSKVYYISPSLNTEKCIAYNDGCDCCDGKIVFLKNNTFISDFYCIPEESFNTGTFEIKSNQLILNYSKKEAILGPENEEEFDGKDTLRVKTINYPPTSLAIFNCHKKYLFKNEADYYSEDTKTSYSEAINRYKKIGVWELLQIKE